MKSSFLILRPVIIGFILLFLSPDPSAFARETAQPFAQGCLAYEQGRYTDAIAAFTLVLDLDSGDIYARLNRSLALLGDRRPEEAEADAAIILDLDPLHLRAREIQGNARYHQGKFAQAEADFDQVLVRASQRLSSIEGRGAARLAQGKVSLAIKDFTRALPLASHPFPILKNLGAAQLKMGQWIPAIQNLSRAIQLKGGDGDLYLLRGIARYGQGNHRRALGDFEKALSIEPANPLACNQAAWLLSACPDGSLRNGKLALDLAQKAIALSPGPATLDTLSMAYAETGDFARAAACQARLIVLGREKAYSVPPNTREKHATFLSGKPWRSPTPIF